MTTPNTDPNSQHPPIPSSGNDSVTPTGGSSEPEGFGMTTSIVVVDGAIGMTPDMLVDERTRRRLRHMAAIDEWAARFPSENVESPKDRLAACHRSGTQIDVGPFVVDRACDLYAWLINGADTRPENVDSPNG